MSAFACSLLGCAADDEREFVLSDYEGATARWCPGCGDHSILTAVERLLAAEQLKPEETVFVVMGDGDCCSIGAGHWIHAVRYNTKMVALLLDNSIYGLTKNQTSPTTPRGHKTNTQPQGSYLPPLDPLTATLGVTNASFVAQTAEWVPAHLYATLRAAFHHEGFAFVRVLQRCPVFMPGLYTDVVRDPSRTELLTHDDGVTVPELDRIYKHHLVHDPRDLDAARRLAQPGERIRLGVFFRDASRARYDVIRRLPTRTARERIDLLNAELDRHAV